MRKRRNISCFKGISLLALLIGLASIHSACTAPQAKLSPGDKATDAKTAPAPAVTVPLNAKSLKAFRNLMLSYYSYRFGVTALASEKLKPNDARALKKEVEKLKDVFEQAKASLSTVLGFQKSETMTRLLKQVKKHVDLSSDEVLFPVQRGDQIASFQLAKIGRNPLLGEVSMQVGKKDFNAQVYGYDKVLVPSYGQFIAERFRKNVGVRSVHYVGERVYVSRPALEKLSREGFFDRQEHYKQCVRQARELKTFLKPDFALVHAMTLTKDVLRWRSLKSVVIDSLEDEEAERREKFVRAFATAECERALIQRVAVYLCEQEKLPVTGARVAFKSWKLAFGRDQGLGHLATCFGLAAAQAGESVKLSEQHIAALQLVSRLREYLLESRDLKEQVAALNLKEASDLDRFAMYHLAKISVKDLKALAARLKESSESK